MAYPWFFLHCFQIELEFGVLVFVEGGKLAEKGKVCVASQVAHQTRAYPGVCSMKQLGVFLLPPGWDASPSQGYPQQ